MGNADLQDRLPTTLGTAYRLERELEGAGMSRVFLAREEALGRDVVVKVLAPALAAGLSALRFEREIQFAARLQDPHIVPVLTTGLTSDGLPYYTMPFVSGESLRSRLEQVESRGAVPVAEAVNILRDVLRALEHAHASGVVHRDIKPENVLLSSGTALVTDFGIAKALQLSIADGVDAPVKAPTLTQAGTSLGTPAYMAPEQGAGDVAIDHRADIYSWGVIAYELLAGRHPFAGKTSARQLIAAHMVETPPPLEGVANVHPSLAALVMQCLEKDPTARPATAAAVLKAIDVAQDRALRDEAIRSIAARDGPTLVRVLLLYVATFVAVAFLARAAIEALGLPDWVLPGALLVMGLGLPVLGVTGVAHWLAQRHAQRRLERGSGMSSSSRSTAETLAMRVRPYLTWRRTAWGGAAALAGFALAVLVYMMLRTFGVGPAGSLLGAGVLEDREQLLIADFQVMGPDSALGPVVAEAVRTELSQSRAVTVVPLSQVAAALERMQRPTTSRIDAALAQEVALREGVRTIVAGDLTPLRGGYLITLRLVTAANGDVLASFRATTAGPEDLIPTLDRLSSALRGKIGESLSNVRADPPLERVTTGSLAALRAYTAAVRAGNMQNDFAKSAALAREAIALDTTFAMAYRVLANALWNARLNPVARDSAFRKAYEHRSRLTERERLLTIASYFQFGPGLDRTEAAGAYEAMLARDPDDYAALNNLGVLYVQLREFERAEPLLRRAIAARPDHALGPYINLSVAQVGRGKVAAAESTAARIMALFPTAEFGAVAGVGSAFAALRFDSAETRSRRWHAASLTPGVRARATEFMTQVARVRGRLAESRRTAAELRALMTASGDLHPVLADTIDAAREDLWIRERPVRAVRRLDALFALNPVASLRTAVDRADALEAAALYAAAGHPKRARALLQQLAIKDTAEQRAAAPQRAMALAEIALAEGRGAEALAGFRRGDVAADGGPISECTVCLLPAFARAAEVAGMADSARILWERYANTHSVRRHDTDPWFLSLAYRRLGAMYTAAGEHQKAADYYGRFLALWRDADPELAPQLAEVRQHLELPRDDLTVGLPH